MSNANRYRGRTPGEAMRKAKTELGDEARLVSARRVSAPNDPPVYEVRVTAAPSASRATGPTGSGLDELRREVESLRQSLGALTTAGPTPASPAEAVAADVAVELPADVEERPDPAFARWLDVLRRRGVGAEVARRLVHSASDLVNRHGAVGPFDAVQRSVASAFPTAPGSEPLGDRSTILVGTTGAGKTTVLSQIAAELAARGQSPVLVSADGESLAGEENLRAVGTALDLRVETAFLDGRLEEVVERLGRSETYLVDCPGRAPFDRDGIESLRGLIRALPEAEVVLVVPASTDADEARLLVEGYESLGPERIVLTKLDEVARPGRIVDLARAVSHPVACVTFGRGVRGTSSAPSDPRVVARILGTELTVDESA